jgi:hypothetical protein
LATADFGAVLSKVFGTVIVIEYPPGIWLLSVITAYDIPVTLVLQK